MKQGTKRGKHYCKSCDKSLVSIGTKCKVCGVRSPKKSLKITQMQEAEYPEVSELDFQLEKMALFMGCSRKVVKYQEQLWNSSDEYYWGWTEGGRWVDKNGFIINEEFYQGDSLLYHTDWNWLHPVISKVYHYSLRKEGYTRGQDVLIEQLKWFTFVGDIDKVFELCITLIDFINTKTQ